MRGRWSGGLNSSRNESTDRRRTVPEQSVITMTSRAHLQMG
jgi:hypothetical protein